MLHPCVICCKLGCGDPIDPTSNQDPLADDDDEVKYEGPTSPPAKLRTLDQFFTFLGRYLDNSHLGKEVGGQETNWPLLEKVIDIMDTKEDDGWNSCENCSKIVDTFCELYDQLKTIQLRLNHQVQKLEEVMVTSGKMENNSQEVDESFAAMSDFKRDLMRKCRQKLKASPPTLKLMDCVKVKSEPDEDEPMPSKFFHEDSSLPPGSPDDLEDDDYAPSPSSSSEDDANSEDGDGTAHLSLNEHNPPIPLEMADEATREAESIEAATTNDLLESGRKLGPTVPWKSTYNPDTLKHTCGYCPKEFVSRDSVRVHYRRAHSQVPYKHTLKCGTCGEQFTLRSQYNRHRKLFHPPCSTHKCNRCGETFKLKRLLQRHQLKPCKVEAGEEEDEDSSGAKPEAIPEPEVIINPLNGMFICSKCPREFTSKGSLQVHFDSEHLNQRFSCLECNKSYRTKMSLRRHRLIVHKGIRLNCPKCEKPFTEKKNLRMHLHTCGTGMSVVGPRQKCPTCGKDIACKTLKLHMKMVHLNVRDHLCNDCGKGFVTKGDLRSHVRCVHLQLREHMCDICGKKFKNSVNLRIHRSKIHSVTV